MKSGSVFTNKPMLLQGIVAILSFFLSFSPLFAAETVQFGSARITRNENRSASVSDASAILAVADFNLQDQHVPNEVLVKFADWTPQEIVDDTLATLGAEVFEVTSGNFTHIQVDLSQLRIPREREEREERIDDLVPVTLKDVLEALDSLPHVDWVEPNYVANALSVPNDPNYSLQWNFPLIGMDSAWDSAQGEGVTVAIIDTGVAYDQRAQYRQATDLAQTSFVSGYNFVYKNNYPNDDNGHGTHIAGTIAGSTNDGFGVAGIAYKASIMPIKALDRAGSGTYSNIAEAIRYAADHGADIVNLSLGGPSPSNVLREAVDYAAGKGVILIGAAGNAGAGSVMYPAAYDAVISVGAVRYDKQKAPYSNYGEKLDLVAPGGDTSVDQNKDGYADGILQQTLKQNSWGPSTSDFSLYFYQGTSMAAPHVAAVAALVKSLGVENPADIKNILLSSTEDLLTPGWDVWTGNGLLRADRAVRQALELNHNAESSGQSETPQPETQQFIETPDTIAENGATTPEKEEPVQEEAPEPETDTNTLADLILDVMTYNMFGRKDMSYAFWEQAILGIGAKDDSNKAVAGVDFNVKVYDSKNTLVAKGAGSSDSEGELLLDLGSFARGVYTIVVQAVADGFKNATGEVSFRFR